MRAFERLAQLPAAKLLLNAGPRRLESRVIPGVAQGSRRGVAHLPHALQQPRLAEPSQQLVERSGQVNRRLRIPRGLHEVKQRKEGWQFQHGQRRRDFGVLALLLIEEPGIPAHRLDPGGRQRRALRRVHPPAQVGAERGIEREMVVAIRRRQPRLDQLDRQRGHVRLFPLHHSAERVQIDPAVKHPEHARPVPVRVRQSAQGKLDAGKDRFLPAAGKLPLHLRHQFDERFAGGLHTTAAQRRCRGRRTARATLRGW